MKPLLVMSMVLFILTGYSGFTLHTERERREAIERDVYTMSFLVFRRAVITYVHENPSATERDIDSSDPLELASSFNSGGTNTDLTDFAAHEDINGQLYVYAESPEPHLSSGVLQHLKAPELVGIAFDDGASMKMRSVTYQLGSGPLILRSIPDTIPAGALVVIGR